MANLLASLSESERGEPNFVEGLASERSSGGVIALKRGLLSLGVVVLLMMEVVVVDCGAKALEVPAAASSRQEMSKGRRAIVDDEIMQYGFNPSKAPTTMVSAQDLSSPMHAQ